MPSSDSSVGVRLIADERQRQIEEEGFGPERDDQYTNGQLAEAAACYASTDTIYHKRETCVEGDGRLPHVSFGNVWPWRCAWWKPTESRVRALQKAGALIAAEIDRLLRQRESEKRKFQGVEYEEPDPLERPYIEEAGAEARKPNHLR